MFNEIEIKKLLDLNQTIAHALFDNKRYPFEVLSEIQEYILLLGNTLSAEEYHQVNHDIWISKRAKVDQSAIIEGPTIIDHHAEIRPNAFIRGNTIIGQKAIVGNSSEIKNSILFNEAKVPHFNYIGDSILGYKAHFGAGSITSNVKSLKSNIILKINEEMIDTKLNKFGAIIGDEVEVGCNAVLNPGTIIGRRSIIYPLTSVRGYIESDSILKLSQEQKIIKKEER